MGKLSPREIKRRRQEAGFARKGPRVKPANSSERSDAGYKVPKQHAFTLHLERNKAIVAEVGDAPKGTRQAVIRKLARQHGLAPKTVDHIARYFKTVKAKGR